MIRRPALSTATDAAALIVLALAFLTAILAATPRIAIAMGDEPPPLAGVAKIPLRAGPMAVAYEGGCR